MLFTNKKNNVSSLPEVSIEGKALGYVEHYCYLGIKLDGKDNFKHHFHHLMGTLQHKILLLYKIRPFIDTRTAVIIYKSHLISYLEYGSIFLDSLPVNMLNKLQRVQNKCLRICYHVDKKTSNVDLHLQSKILPLKLRRMAAICKFFFKQVRVAPEILIEPVRHGNRSSFKRIIYLPMPKSNKYKNCLSYAGCQLWNNLPESICMCDNYLSFLRTLNKYMYNQLWEDGFVLLNLIGCSTMDAI